jgi:hypothetical protein
MKDFSFLCIKSRIEPPRSLYGCFEFGPFVLGQGITVANSLRRELLSELPGLAITEVEIENISHEYSTIDGVRESVLEILLNIKELVFSTDSTDRYPKKGSLQFHGPGTVKAGDLRLPIGIHCVDPNQSIATVSSHGTLNINFLICHGKGFAKQNPFYSQWPKFIPTVEPLASLCALPLISAVGREESVLALSSAKNKQKKITQKLYEVNTKKKDRPTLNQGLANPPLEKNFPGFSKGPTSCFAPKSFLLSRMNGSKVSATEKELKLESFSGKTNFEVLKKPRLLGSNEKIKKGTKIPRESKIFRIEDSKNLNSHKYESYFLRSTRYGAEKRREKNQRLKNKDSSNPYLRLLNLLKIGFLLGFFVDAFKVGS